MSLIIHNFRNSLGDTDSLCSLFEHCVYQLTLPGDYSDLLRMSVVYCMSALDNLIHEIIIHEMVEIYSGRRPPTPKYKAEALTMEHHVALSSASFPPAELVFESIVRAKLSHLSFMDPDKLAGGLSLVWLETHKWQSIAIEMGRDARQTKIELRNLFKRRNAIVHEADRDPGTSDKLPVELIDVQQARAFIGDLGEAIYRLV